ncbi:MAG TPA: hypothetical protein VEL76_16195 [Gemmataceae bacterium]|nr:hypothetical protein [Gemmataceae bacterium]
MSSRLPANAQERPHSSQRPARGGCPVGAACLAPLLWVVAGLTLVLGLLLPLALTGAVLATLALLLAPVALACRGGGGPPRAWLYGHYWCPWLWSWTSRHWLRWADEHSVPQRPRVGHDRFAGGSDTQQRRARA